ncbi:Zn-dependent hydrolase, glyoxylase [Desulfitobacterium dichloroeliminans LMG P-21439]|uniref:Zn-dependent hydrolase, glyoxylase n=1 Tax=Desulfitobacterium dichloroeliminans (strain LMG P-21439 / DCA1) TaxID=871963 RepID=L0FA70_DESDL|nr:MBL fold metallo-hydrolase [Desulfitobacterium dichloroeliminans]AGA69930.1 Zn-dependent hydrolase, glyoxylase [Desulfitobacterium dichloroeliminans LMG P-21439]
MIECRAVGSLGANCYLVSCPETKKAAIIDPGANSAGLKKWIAEEGVQVEYILLTHGHFDHIGAVDDLREHYQAKVGIHKEDAIMLTSGAHNLSRMLGKSYEFKPADFFLEEGQVLQVGNLRLTVIATPGHSLGGVCFLTAEGLISGDTLFDGSVGRADFPGGSMEELINSIMKKLLILPDDTMVYPGHGPETTIGREKRANPFLQ